MPFTIQDFRSKLTFSGARSNQFEVIMPFPACSGGQDQTELFSFMCEAASIPGEQLSTINVSYFGRQIKLPGDRSFQEWSLTIINDEDFAIRDVFEKWSNALNGHFSNLRDPTALFAEATGSGGGGYTVDATVKQYGKTGDVLKEYDMIGCWPATVSPIELSWAGNDEIEKFSVTMEYAWWEAATTS